MEKYGGKNDGICFKKCYNTNYKYLKEISIRADKVIHYLLNLVTLLNLLFKYEAKVFLPDEKM